MEGSPKRPTDLKQRTFEFARRILRMYAALPKSVAAQVLGKQVLRSGTSVGANYREASRARSKAEFIAKVGDSLREIEETEYWLELISSESILPTSRLKPLIDETRELIAIFVATMNTAKRKVERK